MMLGELQHDGVTTREHLENFYRQTGVLPPQLEPVPCPDELQYLWGLFMRVSARRSFDQRAGLPLPLGSLELFAWLRLNSEELEPFEVDVLFALDDVFMRHQYSRRKVSNGR